MYYIYDLPLKKKLNDKYLNDCVCWFCVYRYS